MTLATRDAWGPPYLLEQAGRDPVICVWSVRTCKEAKRLTNVDQLSVLALAFSPCGQFLASVGGDKCHTVNVWRWRTSKLLVSAKGHTGIPPEVQHERSPFTAYRWLLWN